MGQIKWKIPLKKIERYTDNNTVSLVIFIIKTH